MNQNPALSSAAIRRGQHQVERELADAKAAHARAAYDYALNRDDASARKRLIEAKQAMDVLSGELQGLTAAGSEAERLEAIADCDEQLTKLEAAHRDAEALMEQLGSEWTATVSAIASLGEHYARLTAAEDRANSAVRRLGKRDGAQVNPYLDNSFHLRALVSGLLHAAIGHQLDIEPSSAVTNSGAGKDPARAARLIDPACEQAGRRIGEGVKRRRAEIEQRRRQFDRAA